MNPRLARLLVVALALAGCSVPLDDSASPIPDEQLPETLRGTTTTTTTTTSIPEEPITIMYFLIAQPEAEPKKLAPAPREVQRASIREYLDRIFDDDFRTEEEAETLSNALANWTLLSFDPGETAASIDIAPVDPESQPSTEIVRDTAAQLVYFLEQFGIESLRMMINGEERSLPTADELTEPGDPITTALYPLYDPDRILPDPTTTTTTSAPTTTSAAPPSPEPDDGG